MSSSNHSYNRVPPDETEDDDLEDAAAGRLPPLLRRLTVRSSLLAFFITLSIVLTLLVLVTFLTANRISSKPRFVILMVSDGMGPASLSLARTFHQFITNSTYSTQLPLDPYLVGSSRTRSSDSLITDSAAGATAFSCGLKTHNRAIGVDHSYTPCGTVLEAAHLQGYLTGMVVTSSVTDATPASFASHVRDRFLEHEIALQLVGETALGRSVDLLLGGGRCHFLPNDGEYGEWGCRDDDKDLLELAKNNGVTVVLTKSGLETVPLDTLPLLGLFAAGNLKYSIDRNRNAKELDDNELEPTLAEMTARALETLHSQSSKGFFLLIEGSRIDMASHSNDPATHIHDILAYNDAFEVARQFTERYGGVLISTSDHETGGLAVGRQLEKEYPEYAWYPETLTHQICSTEEYAIEVAGTKNLTEDDVRRSLQYCFGMEDVTEEEFELVWENRENALLVDYTVADMIARRAQIGWSTHGHTAVDVNIYAVGKEARERLLGNHENTEIGEFIRDYLDLDLDRVTEILNSGTII